MFESYSNTRQYEGIEFITNSNKTVINYPHQHYIQLTDKNKSTSTNFKETVRMFKTLKEELIDNAKINHSTAKSYYIENLLFNLPNSVFAGNYMNRFSGVLETLIADFNNNNVINYKCANGFQALLSDSTWSPDLLKQFLLGLIFIRDNNEF